MQANDTSFNYGMFTVLTDMCCRFHRIEVERNYACKESQSLVLCLIQIIFLFVIGLVRCFSSDVRV